jgi:hypothetical protein
MVLFNGKQGALAASAATIFMGGVPLFYTGQEVGRQSRVPFFTRSPIDWTMNPDMLKAYHDMMDVYVNHDVARKGDLSNCSTHNLVCFRRNLQDKSMLVLVNVRNQNTEFTLPANLQNTTWTNTLTRQPVTLETTLSLENYQYLILAE